MFLKPKYETGYSLSMNINFHGCKTLIMFNSYTDIAKSSCQNKDHPIIYFHMMITINNLYIHTLSRTTNTFFRNFQATVGINFQMKTEKEI